VNPSLTFGAMHRRSVAPSRRCGAFSVGRSQ